MYDTLAHSGGLHAGDDDCADNHAHLLETSLPCMAQVLLLRLVPISDVIGTSVINSAPTFTLETGQHAARCAP